MLTDDELTTELGAAFRAGTTEVTYRGRRRPRRTAVVAVPVAAVTVAIAALAVGAATAGHDPVPAPAVAIGTPTSPASSAAPALVTDTIELAGYTVTYERRAGEQPPLYATMDSALPDGAKEISAPAGAQAWVGTDPRTGDNTLWVKAPTRNNGKLFALHSSAWSQEQLVDLFHHGSHVAVPLVED